MADPALPPLTAQTLDFGGRAAGAILGLDALYRAEAGDEVGLAVLDMSRSGEIDVADFDDYRTAAAAWTGMRAEAATLPEPDRRRYYAQLCNSSLAFIRWRTEGLGLEEQLTGFLHIPAEPVPEPEVDAIRAELADLLTEMGYGGPLRAQCAAWEERNRVRPDEVPGVVEELLDEAWDRTVERVVGIPSDKGDGMRCAPVSGVPYNARCDYLARTIDLNVDPTLTRPGLKHLAVHEGYPGHYVQFKLRETWFREGTAPADVLLSVVNTASSCVFEGIADAGLAAMGWDDGADDRVQSLLNRHRAAIAAGAAWRLHAVGLGYGEALDWLRSEALVGGDGWVENRMRFISAPERAALIWSYWWGERVVAPAWAAVTPVHRDDFVRFLYGRMHSNETVATFPQSIA